MGAASQGIRRRIEATLGDNVWCPTNAEGRPADGVASGFDDVIANGVPDQLTDRVAVKPPHDVGAVGFRRFYA